MSVFSQELIGRSGYLNEGFADVYDRYRPSPPREVLDVLTVVAGVERPCLVVDLGCGTGLATRAWAERADEVIGVEPNPRMIERARRGTDQPNVRYVEAYGADTSLPDGRAMISTTDPIYIVPQYGWERAAWFAQALVTTRSTSLLLRSAAFTFRIARARIPSQLLSSHSH